VSSTDDYSQFAEPIANEQMALISNLVNEQLQAEADVANAEAALARAQARLKDVAEVRLPTAMEEAGLEELKTPTGLKVSIKEDVRAAITKDNEQSAHQWLRDNGNAGLIKREVKVPFGRGQDALAEKLYEELAEKFEGVTDKASVNVQTLGAFVREQLKEGRVLPESISVYRQRVAKIALPKP
jgi:hypothetical protein